VLRGSYREMGRQYGALLGARMKAMHEAAERAFIELAPTLHASLADIEAFSLSQAALYPRRLQEVTAGISEASGLGQRQLALIDQVVPASVVAANRTLSRTFCSSIVAWGPYTGGGPLLMGRSFDFVRQFLAFNPYLSVIVFNPTDGSVPIANLCYAGQTGGIQMFNAAGLAVESDDGSQITAPNNTTFVDRVPFTALFAELGLDNATPEQLDAALRTMRFNYPLLCNAADPRQGFTYEVGTVDAIRRGDVAEGLQVIANTPIDAHWAMPPRKGPPDPRRDNLITLADRLKGRLDLAAMQSILGTSVLDGGATVTERETAGAQDSGLTIYQFIYVPISRQLYVSLADRGQWTPIGLAPYFQPT